MNEIKFKVDLPYPTVTKCNCKRDAEMLMNAYSGCVGSELSGILQYIYQSYWLKNCYPEIADILEEIAIVEMHHHAMLAEAIVNSCGDPVMSGANMSWWKGDCVCYQKDVICLLKKDICDEQMAIATYQKLACQVCNPTIKELLLRLVLDEEAHVQILKMLCQMVKSSCDPCQQPKQQCGCNNNCSCERQQGCCEKQQYDCGCNKWQQPKQQCGCNNNCGCERQQGCCERQQCDCGCNKCQRPKQQCGCDNNCGCERQQGCCEKQQYDCGCNKCQQPKQQCGCNNNCGCERQQGCCERQQCDCGCNKCQRPKQQCGCDNNCGCERQQGCCEKQQYDCGCNKCQQPKQQCGCERQRCGCGQDSDDISNMERQVIAMANDIAKMQDTIQMRANAIKQMGEGSGIGRINEI